MGNYSEITKQGYEILERHIVKQPYERCDVLCFKRLESGVQYAIGTNYSEVDGTWSQGRYYCPGAGYDAVAQAARAWAGGWWMSEIDAEHSDMALLPSCSLAVDAGGLYLTASPVGEPANPTGIKVEAYDGDGDFVADVCLVEPDSKLSAAAGHAVCTLRTWEPGETDCVDEPVAVIDAVEGITGPSDEAAIEPYDLDLESETLILTDRSALRSDVPAEHEAYLADCADYLYMVDNAVDADGAVFAAEEVRRCGGVAEAKYSVVGGARSLSDLIQSLDCKDGVQLAANAASGEIVVDALAGFALGSTTVTLREIADIDARDRAMEALEDAPSVPTYRAAAKSLFEDVESHGNAVATALVERRELKAEAGSSHEVDVTAVMFDGPRFMMYLPQGTDVSDWMGKPGAVEALKKAMHKAIDEADLDMFDAVERFEETMPASKVTYLA